MSNSLESSANSSDSPQEQPTATVLPPRVWPAVTLVAAYWIIHALLRGTDFGISLGFLGFLLVMATTGALILLFLVWWLTWSRVRWRERLYVLGAAILISVVTPFLAHKTAGGLLMFYGLPLGLTVWTLGLLALRTVSGERRTVALCALLVLTGCGFLLVRTEGVDGAFQFALRTRWSPTAEQVYLAERASHGNSANKPVEAAESSGGATMSLQPGDWPGFRGPNRDGAVHDVKIATNWNEKPPRLLWKRKIGPAWSSVAVVGDRLFTQEQLGDKEAVDCLDAATGHIVWSHEDPVRHEDDQGGAGPRATPTFAAGRIFALGATGILNCLDARTGKAQWSRNIADDAATKKPMWGFSSSPLVTDDLVIVFACGDFAAPNSLKALRAYRADTGKPAWSIAAGKIGYSSPQLCSIGDAKTVLSLSDSGLFAVDPSSGHILWDHATPVGSPGVPRCVQPQVVPSKGILFDAGPTIGTVLTDAEHSGESWVEEQRWASRFLKPSFNDFVVYGNAAYGFDARVLTCIDLETGKQRWKGGRYGSGQVLLLADQPLLLVISEKGEAVLVAADPNEHHELGRFQAIEGKTWNHPVIAHGRLYVRNSEEFACYELGQ
jgi:outer membrane protein assembly factor BamB